MWSGPPEHSRSEVATALANLATYRSQIDARRESLAGAAAEAVVAELVALAPTRTDADLEDDLCTRIGIRLREWDEASIEDHVAPNPFAEAIVAAAATSVRAALDRRDAEPDGWQGPWRVLAATARIVHYPLHETVTDAVNQLRDGPGRRVLPPTPAGPAATGEVRWTRDAYGSRFGVTAAFSAPQAPHRWYLWDIDACGHEAFTVYCGYFPDPERALAQWRAGVGPVATVDAAFTPVDDPSLLAELLPFEEGFMRSGGESAVQFAEYHRSRRLAEAVRDAVDRDPAGRLADLDAAAAVTEFTDWLRARRAGEAEPADLAELVEELADSWRVGTPVELYGTCSPHRVALTVRHLRDYYQDDFADRLVALLPEWTCWLAARNGTPPELAERVRPYALGKPHPDLGSEDRQPEYLARVAE